jgi:hypothetical protein
VTGSVQAIPALPWAKLPNGVSTSSAVTIAATDYLTSQIKHVRPSALITCRFEVSQQYDHCADFAGC